MRLNRLELIRYGRFQEAEIGFPRRAGSPDVTVIFGPNEAGKSTAFNGLLELLFGFKAGAHPYAFRFARADLLVGAELDLPGRGPVVFRRNSKRQQSLVDAEGRPLNDAVLAGALHGLTRDTFEERFSLNEQGLRAGGERIAGAQGDLGQLLHAGLSGLTGMAETLDKLAARADLFHKKRGRGTVLKNATDRLKEIGRDLRADLLTTERARSLQRACDTTSKAFEAADAAQRRVYRRQAAAQAAQLWYDRTEEMLTQDAALAALPDGPGLVPGAAERVAGLVEKIAVQTARMAEATEDIDKQRQIIADSPEDRLAVPLKAELERLDGLTIDGAPLMSRATTAQADLSRRLDDQEALSGEMEAVLAQLGVAEAPASALALQSEALEDLAEAAQACISADQAARAARETLETARQQLGEAPAEPSDLTALRAAFAAWSAVADIAALEGDERRSSGSLAKAVAGLPERWPDLIARGLPARESLDAAARERADLTAALAAAAQERDSRSAELAEAQADLSALEAAPEAVDIARIEATRRRRDIDWQRHREDMTPDSATRFQDAMYDDDSARAHYLTGAEARQRLAAAQNLARSAEARLNSTRARHDEVKAQSDRLAQRCAVLAAALGLEEDTLPAGFAPRHQALTLGAGAAADLSIAQDALTSAQTRRQAARDALAEAARAVGLEPEQGDVPARVQRALTLEDSDRRAWDKWQQGSKAVAGLEDRLRECRDECVTAEARLTRLTATLPLPDASPEGVRRVLPHLRELQQSYSAHSKLTERIEALRQAIAGLEAGAARLAAIMHGPDAEAGADPLAVLDTARARLATAQRAEDIRQTAAQRLEEAEAQARKAKTALSEAEIDLAACFEGQGAPDLPPRDRVAKLAERDRLRAARSAAETARQTARASVDRALFEEELAILPDATRAAELQQALDEAQDARDAARDAQREADRLYREAFEAADRSDLALEQATLREELRSGALQAAVARLGVLAAQGALRRLAAERRSGMLRDVEAAFVKMTAPAWSGVEVWSQAEGEKLVGRQPDGSTVPVEQMSTGTMGQLYFALRLAGYQSFARQPGPLPMILDDILETFDDTRARAALQLCAEIGEIGQALLFTHHAHLVDLARDCIRGVSIVDMPA